MSPFVILFLADLKKITATCRLDAANLVSDAVRLGRPVLVFKYDEAAKTYKIMDILST